MCTVKLSKPSCAQDRDGLLWLNRCYVEKTKIPSYSTPPKNYQTARRITMMITCKIAYVWFAGIMFVYLCLSWQKLL